MKNSTILKIILLFIGVSITFVAICQPPPPPPPPPNPLGVPLDGGVTAMLLGLGAYGLKKYFNVDIKKFFSVILFVCIFSFTQAQKLEWAVNFGGPDQNTIAKTVFDKNGNIYSVGRTIGNIDLDPGVGVNQHIGGNSFDVFIQKLDSNGVFIWGRTFGGGSNEEINDLAIDSLGNLVLVGSFVGTIDFDPGLGVHNETSSGYNKSDGYILKIDKNGNFVWVRTLKSSGVNIGESVVINSSNEIFVTGLFSKTVDFDFGPGVSTLYSSFGFLSFFLKIDSNGTFDWVYKIESHNQIILSYSSNSVVISGVFHQTVDFDPSINVDYYSTNNNSAIFLSKFDEAGNYIFTKIFDTPHFSIIEHLDQDVYGNIYASGTYGGTVDFNPNIGVNNMTAIGNGNSFLLKLDNSGNYVWAKSLGENGTGYLASFTVDELENIYSVGHFGGWASNFDLDPGPNQVIEIATDVEVFILKLNSSGQYVNHRTIGSPNFDGGSSITINNHKDIIVSGRVHSGSPIYGVIPADVNFNKNYCPFILTGFGSTDPFIAKFSQKASIWTGQTNSDWNTTSNWLGGVPDEDSDIRIPDVSSSSNVYPVINIPTVTGQITVDSNAALVINEGITLNSSFLNNGTVILKDGAYLDEYTNNQCYLGNITVERIAANGVSFDQRMISSPVNNPDVTEIGDDLTSLWASGLTGINNVAVSVNCGTNSLIAGSNYGNLFQYNETIAVNCPLEGWEVRSSGNLENGRGYSAYLSNASTFDFTGSPNAGNVSVYLTNSNTGVLDAEGWNLIGNPYPSPISRDAVINAGVTDAQYFVTSGVYQGSYSPYLPQSDIAIAQGFQVYTASNQTITFDNSFRSTNAVTWYSTEAWFDHKLEISVFGHSFADKTILYYREDAGSNYEPLDDVTKVKSKHGQPSLSTSSASKNLALNGLAIEDLNEIVPLNLDPGVNGNFSISIDGLETFPENTAIYIRDLLLDEIHDITVGDYNFSSDTLDDFDRFELIIIPGIAFETDVVDCNNNVGGIQLVSNFDIENRLFELKKDAQIIASDSLVNLNRDLTEGNYELIVSDVFNGEKSYVFEIERLESIQADFSLSSTEINVGDNLVLENLCTNATSFVWQLNNESFSNVDVLDYSFEQAGKYQIVLAVENQDCMDSQFKEITVLNKTTALVDIEFDQVQIFPNPSKDFITIEIGNEELTSLKLLDLSGRTVQVYEASLRQLNIAEFTSGIYFLEIANADKKSVIKIIKK